MPKKLAQKKTSKKFTRKFLYFCTSCALVFVFLLISFNLKSLATSPNILGVSTQIKEEELKKEELFWQNFLSKNPEYIPGLTRLSEIEESLGKLKEKQNLLLRIQEIDANRIIP